MVQQWHTSADADISAISNPPYSYDWIFSVIQTDKKEYIGCGYSSAVINGTTHEIVPAFFKLDSKGKVMWIKKVLTANYLNNSSLSNKGGHLWQVVQNANSFVAAGYMKNANAKTVNLVVVFDESGTITQSIAFDPPCNSTDICNAKIFNESKLRTMTMVPGSSTEVILAGEAVYTSGSAVYKYLQVCKFNLSNSTVSSRIVGGSHGNSTDNYYGGNSAYKVLTRPNGSSYDIYLSGYKSVSGDNVTSSGTDCNNTTRTVWKRNKDIWLLVLHDDLTDYWERTYNKGQLPGLNSNYLQTGPLSARNINSPHLSCTVPTFVQNALTESANDDERGIDLILTSDGHLAMTAMINRVSTLGEFAAQDENGANFIGDAITNSNFTTAANPEKGFVAYRGSGSTNPYYYRFYLDADVYLLRLDAADGDLLTSGSTDLSKNIGHFSSREFMPRVIENCMGEFIVAGSSADYYGSGDPDLTTPNKYDIFLVATDDNTPGHKWRRALHSAGEGAVCVFALTKTADDGFLVAGDNDMNGDDFSLTKFAPSFAPQQSYNVYGSNGVYTLTGNTTWNTSRKIKEKVIVPSGVTLTITGSSTVISFASSDHVYDFSNFDATGADGLKIGIVVEPNGKLIVQSGATLQGLAYTPCSSSSTNNRFMWDGIVVKGNPSLPQTLANQGYVSISQSTIKDARFAVEVADARRRYETTPTTTYVNVGGNYDWTHYGSKYNELGVAGGGLVQAEANIFSNCYGGIKFQNYGTSPFAPTVVNGSYMKGNTFTCTTPMADLCEFPGETGIGRPSSEFISAWRVTGVRVFDNVFTCPACTTYSFKVEEQPLGVNIYDAGMYIERYCTGISNLGNCIGGGSGNSFSYLKAGVQAVFGPLSFTALPLSIKNNSFNLNADGILVSASKSLTIKENTFMVPAANPPDLSFPTGATLQSCRAYDVSENSFGHCTSCSTIAAGARGIVINNGHPQDERIYRNTFNNLEQPSIALHNNGSSISSQIKGLQFRCNQYLANNSKAIMRVSHSTNLTFAATLRAMQGSCTNSSSPAGNLFYNATPTTTNDNNERLFSDGSVTQLIDYYSHSSATNFDPDHPSVASDANNSIFYCNSTTTYSESCPSPYSYGTGVGALKMAELEDLNNQISEITEEDEIYPELTMLRNETISDLSRNYGALNYPDSAARFLEDYGRYEEALDFYVAAGMSEDATRVLDLLSGGTEEEQNYATLINIVFNLYSSGLDLEDLGSDELSTLQSLAGPNSVAGSLASAILATLGIEEFNWPRPLIGEMEYRKIGEEGGSSIGATQMADFSVFPNPSRGSFIVHTDLAGFLTISNVQGVSIKTLRLETGSNNVDLRTVAAGVYFATFKSDASKEPKSIRLIIKP